MLHYALLTLLVAVGRFLTIEGLCAFFVPLVMSSIKASIDILDKQIIELG